METLLPNQERARWAIISLWVNMCLALVLAGAQWWQAALIKSGEMTNESAEESDSIVSLIAILFLGSLIVSATTFIMWFRRAYANLHRLDGVVILNHTEGWAAGAWFVPILNLFRPFEIMKEIWWETQNNIPGKAERDGIQSNELIGWWWGSWVTYNIVSRLTSRMSRSYDPDVVAFWLRADALGSLLVVPAAILAVQVIQRTNRFEQELYTTRRMSDPSEHLLA